VKRAAIFAAVIVAAIAGPALADPAKPPVADQGVVERSRVELAPSGHPFKQLVIENPLGDVRVEGYDGHAIMIETRKRAPDEDTLDRLRVSLVPNADGTVRITTTADGGHEVKPVGRGAVRIDLLIHAPRDARVDAAAAAGKLELVNMDAGGELDTSSGAISVLNVQGALVTHTVTGPMTIAEAFGSVDAQTVASNLNLDGIGGERLIASAGHGTIAGRRVRSSDIELTTTDGKIVLEAEAALRGHLVVSSLRGDVTVRLHRKGALVVQARGVKVDLGGQAQTQPNGLVVWNDGQPPAGELPTLVELRSRYGAVQFAVVQ